MAAIKLSEKLGGMENIKAKVQKIEEKLSAMNELLPALQEAQKAGKFKEWARAHEMINDIDPIIGEENRKRFPTCEFGIVANQFRLFEWPESINKKYNILVDYTGWNDLPGSVQDCVNDTELSYQDAKLIIMNIADEYEDNDDDETYDLISYFLPVFSELNNLFFELQV